MKITLFTETYVPNINGVATHVKLLRNGLVKLGHEVLVVCADKHARHHYIEDGVLHCPAAEIKRIYGYGAALPVSRKRLRLITCFNPDIIHIHHEFGIGLSGIMAAKFLKKPLIYTLHTMYDQYIYYIAPRILLKAATKFSHKYEKFIARNATELTGPSQKCSEYFKKIGIEKECNLIPNSADLEAFNPDRIPQEEISAARAKLGIPDDRMIACFVGRLGKEKSVDIVLEHWAKTITPEDKLHLLVIGDGPEKPILEEMAAKLGISDMVTFTGLIRHEALPAYFMCCDVYVTASLSDTNSISMLEGMATGLMVLQRYDELNLDQIKTGENGYMFRDAEEMAKHLRELRSLSSQELKERKEAVVRAGAARGSVELANYMLKVYEKAMQNNQATKTPIQYRLKRTLRLP